MWITFKIARVVIFSRFFNLFNQYYKLAGRKRMKQSVKPVYTDSC